MDKVFINHRRDSVDSSPERVSVLPAAMTHIRAAREMVNSFNCCGLGASLSVEEPLPGEYLLIRTPQRRSYSAAPANAASLRVMAAMEWLRAVRCGLLEQSRLPLAVAGDAAFQLVRACRSYENALDSVTSPAPRVTIAAGCDEILLILAPPTGRSITASHIMRFKNFNESVLAIKTLTEKLWSPFPEHG